jgi:hypothetical protein
VRLDLTAGANFDFVYRPSWEMNGVQIDLLRHRGRPADPLLPFALPLPRGGRADEYGLDRHTDPVELSAGLGFSVLPRNGFFQLSRFTVDGTLKENEAITGKVNGYFAEFGGVALADLSGTATYDWAKGDVKLAVQFDFLDALKGGVVPQGPRGAGATASGNLSGKIPTEIQVPFSGSSFKVPWIGGKDIAGRTSTPRRTSTTPWRTTSPRCGASSASTSSRAGTRKYTYDSVAGVKVFFDGNVDLHRRERRRRPAGAGRAAHAPRLGLGVPRHRRGARHGLRGGAGREAAAARHPLDGALAGSGRFEVIRPDGEVVDEAGFEAAGIFSVPSLDSPTGRTLAVADPARASGRCAWPAMRQGSAR